MLRLYALDEWLPQTDCMPFAQPGSNGTANVVSRASCLDPGESRTQKHEA